MSERAFRGAGFLLTALSIGAATPVVAECTGQSCHSGFGIGTIIFLLVILGLLFAVVALPVLLIRRKWRPALILAAALGGIFVVLPLVTRGVAEISFWRSARHEVLGVPPFLAGRVPLLIETDMRCDYVCKAVVTGAGPRGIISLVLAHDPRMEGKEGWYVDAVAPVPKDPSAAILPPTGARDPGAPLTSAATRLAALPLELWYIGEDKTLYREPLSSEDKARFVANVDYLVIAGNFFGARTRGLPEAWQDLLAEIPALAGLPGSSEPRLLLAAFPAAGDPDFRNVKIDLLEAQDHSWYFSIPFLPSEESDAQEKVPHEFADRFLDAVCQISGNHTVGSRVCSADRQYWAEWPP